MVLGWSREQGAGSREQGAESMEYGVWSVGAWSMRHGAISLAVRLN